MKIKKERMKDLEKFGYFDPVGIFYKKDVFGGQISIDKENRIIKYFNPMIIDYEKESYIKLHIQDLIKADMVEE